MSLLCAIEIDERMPPDQIRFASGGSSVLLFSIGDLLKYSYGCVMLMVDPASDAGQKLKELRDSIPDEDLMAKGREDEPHVTVRYGILDTASEAGIASYLTQQGPFTITLGRTMVFPATEHSDNAAVVVVQVDSPELERINDEVAAAGEFKPANFDYHPHITLAYIREESAEKWADEDSVEGLELEVKEIVIKSKDGAATPVALTGTSDFADSIEGEKAVAAPNQTCPDCWNDFPKEVAACPWCNPAVEKARNARVKCSKCGKFMAYGQSCASCAPSPTQGIESTPDESTPETNSPGDLPAPADIGIKASDDPAGDQSPESGGGAVGQSAKDVAMAAAADRSENP